MTGKKGLYHNVNKRRAAGKAPKKKGDTGYPSDESWEKSAQTAKEDGSDPCWSGYKQVGTKKKGGKQVPNCVPEDRVVMTSSYSEEIVEGEILNVQNGRVEILSHYGIKHVPVSAMKLEGYDWVNEDGSDIELDEYVVFDDYTGEILDEKKDVKLTKKHKSKEGGLTDAGRKKYNRETGSNLKRPQPKGGKRRTSYCARSKGQQDDHSIDCRKDPDKRICKARKRWNC